MRKNQRRYQRLAGLIAILAGLLIYTVLKYIEK
nr:MAG TPA: hypothetical protein [Caudoviricetes sp.]